MIDNYARLIHDNLQRLYAGDLAERSQAMAADQQQNSLAFRALGQACRIHPDGITLDERPISGPVGIIISLYALHAKSIPERLTPLKAFKELGDSMPYAGAFATHSERILVPFVAAIEAQKQRILTSFQGRDATDLAGGDFALLLRPLPKIFLCYIFYRADEEFPAAVTCLFSNNADQFLPIDGLADLAEYTSKKMMPAPD